MKATIFVNTLENYISNKEIISIMEGLNDPFYGQIVKENIEVSVSLWDVRATMTGYGHWKISVKLVLEFSGHKKELVLTHTTTDSLSIDAKNDSNNDERKAEGYLSLFSECMNNNDNEVYEALDVEGEETA